MALQHSLIEDPDIHEVKGASSATNGQMLSATGAGSSQWVDRNSILPIGYAELNLISNAVTTPTTAAIDSTLHTGTDYTDFTNLYTEGVSISITIDPITKLMTVAESGVYVLTFWSSVSSSGTNDTTALSWSLNGVAQAATHPVGKAKLKVIDDITLISAVGYEPLSAGDEVGISAATTDGSTLTFHEGSFTINLLEKL